MYSFLLITSFSSSPLIIILTIAQFLTVHARYSSITGGFVRKKNEKEIKLELEIQETKKELYELVEKVSV